MSDDKFPGWHGTTILAVRKGGQVVVAGDGQVSLGQTVIKGTARKVRRLSPGGRDVVCGFAGSTADAFTLLERLEKKLESSPGQLARACVDLAKDWRMDKYLRNLEAMLIVTDGRDLFVITGAGDVLEPEHDVAAIGSGGNFALAAARGLMNADHLSAEDIARKASEVQLHCAATMNRTSATTRLVRESRPRIIDYLPSTASSEGNQAAHSVHFYLHTSCTSNKKLQTSNRHHQN
jgi:ATP-dependent HslUV protease subunit HslV